MATYEELDPELAWKAVEGFTDELAPAIKVQDAFYRQFQCLRCKGELHKEFDAHHAYSDSSSVIARALLRCDQCGFLQDPHTGLIIEQGSPAKVPSECVPIIGVKSTY
jgi:hypothetical protein